MKAIGPNLELINYVRNEKEYIKMDMAVIHGMRSRKYEVKQGNLENSIGGKK